MNKPVTNAVETGMHKIFLSLGLAAMMAAFAPSAIAQDAGAKPAPGAGAPGKQQAWQQHCQADVDKLCKDAIQKDAVPDCLAAKEDQLSEECQKSFLYKWKVAQTCKGDIEKICRPKMAQGMKLGECFKDHQKEFSEPCRNAIMKGQKQFKAEKKAEGAEAPAAAEPAADAKKARPRKKKQAE